tara:strand:- start:5246 stop:5656 length:411 start_codon:yes stop_codon:yes gene_type:complete
MLSTRFHYDECRKEKQEEQIKGPGLYTLQVPGHNIKPYFINDPFIRIQNLGGKLNKQNTDLERKLMGGEVNFSNTYKKENFKNIDFFTEQTRSTNPSWNIKDLETSKLEPYYCNENRMINFEHNISTRELKEKYHK